LRSALNDRLYPPRPILAVSLAVFREGRALIARRARAPLSGLYSLPGGVVEIGESLSEAALRELDEEVGVKAEIVAFNDHVESIVRDDNGGVRAHYVIASFVARWVAGEARTSAEADSVLWIDPAALNDLPATPGLANILTRAASLIGAAP
jgi:ADP-ribose pyrophosphatase YjhB (NUDIX family)